MSETDIYTAVLTVIGIVFFAWKSKRRFDRMNQLGIEQYANYSQKIGAKILDGILYSVGFVFLVTAAIAFFIEHVQSIPILSATFALYVIFLIFGIRSRSRKLRK